LFPYWVLFLLVTATASVERARPNTRHPLRPALFAIGVLMTLMIGLRYNVGGDWRTYMFMFEYVERRTLEAALERGDIGYQILSWLLAHQGFDIWVLNLFCGLVFTWGLIQLARNQPSPMLAILVAIPYLFVVVAMGYTRQGVAIGIIMAGLAATERGAGIVRFAAYVLVAALFHRTAIVVLPIVMFAVQRNKFVSVVAGVLLTFGLYTSLLADSMDEFVKNYVEAGYQSQGAAIRVAMNLMPAILMLWRGRELQLGENQYRLWRLFALVAVALVPALFLVPSSTAVDRLALYVLPIQVVVLPRLVLLFKRQSLGRATVIAYCALVLFVWITFANHSKYWIPYETWPFGETVRANDYIEESE
jgi:hypothetical protein